MTNEKEFEFADRPLKFIKMVSIFTSRKTAFKVLIESFEFVIKMFYVFLLNVKLGYGKKVFIISNLG